MMTKQTVINADVIYTSVLWSYETFFLEIERVTGLFIDRNKTLHSPLILEKSASAVPMNDIIFHKLYICNLRAKLTRIN